MFIGDDNKEVRNLIRQKVSDTFHLSASIYDKNFLSDLFCDVFLPGLVFFYSKSKFQSFKKYIKQCNFDKDFSNLSERVRNCLLYIEELDYKKLKTLQLKVMGDLHPNYSTKVLSKTSVIYGKYPEYFDLLDRITKLFWKNNEDFFPSIKGLEEFSIRNFIDINKETESEEIIKDFYFNLGSLISFLFSIRAVDINAENMIVNLPNPVFYDMETIFSGSFEEDYDVYGALNTGFVKINEKRDMSLLTGGIGERESLLKPIITGTDKQPQIRWRTLSKGKYNNIPILNGSYVKAGDYINSLRRGGFDSFGKINKQKEEIKDIVKNTRTITRVVLRPTRIYRHLMLQTVYPQVFLNEDIETYLRNKLEDLRVIYDIEDPESIINYEIAALKIFQIPTFYSDIQSKDILSANGDVVARWGISQYEIWEKYFFESFNKDFIENQFQIIEDLIE